MPGGHPVHADPPSAGQSGDGGQVGHHGGAVPGDADGLVVDRAPNPHLAFGIGPHRCIGMHLARALFRIMMREVLDRVPDHRVDRQGTTFYQRDPSLAGVATMPVTFTPAPLAGPSERPY